jgi:hypothetical protein
LYNFSLKEAPLMIFRQHLVDKKNIMKNNSKSCKNLTIPEKLTNAPDIGHISFHLSSAPGLV